MIYQDFLHRLRFQIFYEILYLTCQLSLADKINTLFISLNITHDSVFFFSMFYWSLHMHTIVRDCIKISLVQKFILII